MVAMHDSTPTPARRQRLRRQRMSRPSPSWGADLRDLLIKAVAGAVLWTALMLLSGTGWMHTQDGTVIDADGVWAGLLAGFGPVVWAFSMLESRRADHGFRTRGLPGLMLLAVPAAAGIQVLSMLAWPLVVDGSSVIARYSADPVAFAHGAALVVAVFAWSALAIMPAAGGRGATTGLAVIGLLVIGGLGAWQGVRTFDGPPSLPAALVWAAVALLGLLLVPLVALLVMRARGGTAASTAPGRALRG